MGFRTRKRWFLSNEEIVRATLALQWKLGMTNFIHNLLQLYKRFSFVLFNDNRSTNCVSKL